jgi:hypothetical protein
MHRWENKTGRRRRQGKIGETEKMQNSGNKAKKWLKTKDITFFSAANYARFLCKFTQIGH